MSRNEIIEKLRDIMAMVTGSQEQAAQIREDTRLVEDMGLNSVGILYIVVGIEEMFRVRFDDVGFGDFCTAGDVIDYIEKKVNV